MSLINEYNATEQAIKDLQAKIDVLRQDPSLARELEFKDKLVALMEGGNKTLRDVIALLDPQSQRRGKYVPISPSGRSSRRVKRYKNPHNGEVIETKGGNHKALQEWKKKWGGDEVESWATYKD